MDQASASGLPFHATAHDSLRHGLPALKDDAAPPHPVQVVQQTTPLPGVAGANPAMLRDLYGLAFPARMELDRQILSRVGRLPGLPSSRLGLESLSGALDAFGFESYLNQPEHAVQQPPPLHDVMEARLGLAPGTKPLTRGNVF